MTLYDAGIKVHVPTPEISKLVQEKLFEKGFKWSFLSNKVIHTTAHYLYVDSEGGISWGESVDGFALNKKKQVHYLQILADDFDGQFYKTSVESKSFYQDSKGCAHWVDDSGHYDNIDWSREFVKYQDDYTFLNVNEEEIKMIQPNEMPKLEAGKHIVVMGGEHGLILNGGICQYIKVDDTSYTNNILGGWDNIRMKEVVKVYELHTLNNNNCNFSILPIDPKYHTLVWEKVDPAKQALQSELDDVMSQIDILQTKANKLSTEISEYD